jgi:uncharacterized protein YggT (Ycf19 family)
VIPAALTRGDLANYVDALFLVYIVLIFLNVLSSWIPRMPYNRWLRAVLDFVSETTNPYLNLFRRVIPPLGGFGLADGGGVALIALTLGALLFVGVLFARNPTRPWMWVAVGLLAGGALGNLADRIRADAVTDYVDFLAWPPFNLADVAIVVGVAILALSYLREADG